MTVTTYVLVLEVVSDPLADLDDDLNMYEETESTLTPIHTP